MKTFIFTLAVALWCSLSVTSAVGTGSKMHPYYGPGNPKPDCETPHGPTPTTGTTKPSSAPPTPSTTQSYTAPPKPAYETYKPTKAPPSKYKYPKVQGYVPAPAPAPAPAPQPAQAQAPTPAPAPAPVYGGIYQDNHSKPKDMKDNYYNYQSPKKADTMVHFHHHINGVKENTVHYETGHGIRSSESTMSHPSKISHAPTSGSSSEEEEEGKTTLVKTGEISWTSPEGVKVHMSYIADENGYRVLGSHVPKTASLSEPEPKPETETTAAPSSAPTSSPKYPSPSTSYKMYNKEPSYSYSAPKPKPSPNPTPSPRPTPMPTTVSIKYGTMSSTQAYQTYTTPTTSPAPTIATTTPYYAPTTTTTAAYYSPAPSYQKPQKEYKNYQKPINEPYYNNYVAPAPVVVVTPSTYPKNEYPSPAYEPKPQSYGNSYSYSYSSTESPDLPPPPYKHHTVIFQSPVPKNAEEYYGNPMQNEYNTVVVY